MSQDLAKQNEPTGIPSDGRVLAGVRRMLRETIAETAGREVSFVGLTDSEGVVILAWPVARGDFSAVAAPLPQLLKGAPPAALATAAELDTESEPAGRVLIHNHPGGNLTPSRADINVAATLAQDGIGSWIIDNEADRIYILTEAFTDTSAEKLDEDELAGHLEPGGSLDQQSTNFESRPSQVAMLRKITKSFNENRILACEAGTGVGKSFAYLIPAISWAAKNGQRVVISTATINLQHQLFEKDIPMVQKLLGTRVKTVIAKGRNNYLCLNRLEEVLEEDSLFRENDDTLHRIAEWAGQTPNGERSDVSFRIPESLWARINSDPDSCSGVRCRSRDTCFLMKARREASQAGIIVVNHHLFFADAAMRSQGFGYEGTVILPAFSRVIFDEAHSIEQAATSYFSRELTRFSLHKYLNMLLRRRGAKSFGLVTTLRGFLGLELAEAESRIDEVRSVMADTEKAIFVFLGDMQSLRLHPLASSESPDFGRVQEGLLGPLAALQTAILGLADHLVQELKSLDDEDLEQPPINDLRILIRRLEDMASLCEDMRRYTEDPQTVFWIERSRLSLQSQNPGEQYLSLTATPLDIAGIMREQVFQPYDTVVLASATLTVQKSFNFFAARVGLSGMDTDQGIFESPFDYGARVLLAVPGDAPQPQSPEYAGYLVGLVKDAILISKGKALVLFTSYASLNQVFEGVRPYLEAAGIPVHRQGDDDKTRLLKAFRDDTASVLFATDSFWEGIDAPGSALELLILCRLPFKVPTDPVLMARAEAIEARGGSSFMEMSVPDAIMKFKQGFGRLMRRSDDRGVVLVTDVRLVQKSYGRIFLESLPRTKRSIDQTSEVLGSIRRFFDTVV